MATSATSFDNLLPEISDLEWAIDYDNLALKIFEERVPHDTDSELQSKVEIDQLAIMKAEKVFGRQDEKQQLLSKLMDPPEEGNYRQFSAIPITGGGGLGKTTLARLVYEDDDVKEHFELRAWVEVRGQALGLQHVARQLIESAIGLRCSLDDVDEMVRDTLQSYRCLIVFDEIDSMEHDWWVHMERFWFNVVGYGSKVLITTTSKNVAHLVANQPFELSQLSSYDGRLLCEDVASDGVTDTTPTYIAENLACLCRGIPLLLKLVGSLMRYDGELRNVITSLYFLDTILHPSSDESLLVISLCVWALPLYLKQCLTYCALFPRGCAMNKEKIIDMWIAHDLVKASKGNKKRLHSIGDSYFHHLLCRSFFTDITWNQYGDISEFRIPALIHQILHRLATIIWKGKLGVIGSIAEDAGQLSLVLPFVGEFNSDHLRMLIVSPSIHLHGSLDHSLVEFKELQSLDLSCSFIRNLPDDICMLKELSYLDLSYTLVQRLPDSITNLSRLQTLDLSGCYYLQVLPDGLCNLIHMNHLDLSLCESLSYLPFGIGCLVSLSSMPLFVLGKDQNCACLTELGWLNQLRGRLEIRNLENVREVSEARKAKLYQKDLHHLGLSWSHNADGCLKILEVLRPNPHLKVLELTGYMGPGFPWWMSSIKSLAKISITNCRCEELPSLGQLPFLKELLLKGMMNIQAIGDEFYGDGIADFFPSLEQLGLYDMPRLLIWSSACPAFGFPGYELRMFRRLKYLTVEDCPQLQIFPYLSFLHDLIVTGSDYRIISSLTGFISLSSLLIKDMGLRAPFLGLSLLNKLILVNVNNLDASYLSLLQLTALKHLGIRHCHELRDIILCDLISLQKLHVVDCGNLVRILFVPEVTTLIELVVEDCPKLHHSSINIHNRYFPRKLIIRSSSKFILKAEDFKELQLDYLSISGCPWLERQVEMEPSLISHIPCVVAGNNKANCSSTEEVRVSIFKGRQRMVPTVDDEDLFTVILDRPM